MADHKCASCGNVTVSNQGDKCSSCTRLENERKNLVSETLGTLGKIAKDAGKTKPAENKSSDSGATGSKKKTGGTASTSKNKRDKK